MSQRRARSRGPAGPVTYIRHMYVIRLTVFRIRNTYYTMIVIRSYFVYAIRVIRMIVYT